MAQAKFNIYLSYSASQNKFFALKIFPNQEDGPGPYFFNEIRFSQLKHPNINAPLYFDNTKVLQKGKIEDQDYQKSSFVLSEYQEYGDLQESIINNEIPLNETMIRTLFH